MSRVNKPAYTRASRNFRIPIEQISDSTDFVKFDSRWLLGPKAGLFPHQILSSSEQIHQSQMKGGGFDGSKMGIGKTHPWLVQVVVKYWIQRLRFQIAVDEKKGKSTRHLIYDGHPKDAICPSRKSLPINCPCEPKSWTRNYEIPPGCFIMLALPHTIREWVKAVKDLFEGAQLLDDPEFPFRIAIEHADTTNELRRTLRERSGHKTRKGEVLPNHLAPLTREEMVLMARLPDWSKGDKENA
ncbi:hypothetical protein K469DRAFT_756708 [Zopfia rhizophila CBS 207.26]|nr:hypothetical protein K469DRAFT_756708 [Zopfia rhizophila CBS 207.26]